MRLFAIPALLASLTTLTGCQSTQDTAASRGAATFCDRVIRWDPVGADGRAERAVIRPEICAKPSGQDVWIKVPQVHTRLGGRQFFVLLRSDDPHLQTDAEGTPPRLAGWTLQARPFSYAHEIIAIRSEGAEGPSALATQDCPRKAAGKKNGQSYCIAAP